MWLHQTKPKARRWRWSRSAGIRWTPQAWRWWCINNWECAWSILTLKSSITPTRRLCWTIHLPPPHDVLMAPLVSPTIYLQCSVISVPVAAPHSQAWALLFLHSQVLTQWLFHRRHSLPVCQMKKTAWTLFLQGRNQGQTVCGKTLGKSLTLPKPPFPHL